MSIIVSGKSYYNVSIAAKAVVRDFMYADNLNSDADLADMFEYHKSDSNLAAEILDCWELPEELNVNVLCEAMSDLRKEVMKG